MMRLLRNTCKQLKSIPIILWVITTEVNINNCQIELSDFKLQMFDWALEDYSKAISINPQFHIPYNSRGLVYEQLKQYKEALKDLEIALQINRTQKQIKCLFQIEDP
ncbi:unnamed protein product [Paramecium octaurelia]|uniref:Tetratricopeptide repeat protein n=1 Tax=Paramecium octaurelia TaxID=43137 RepID=A0A8S1TLW1_PAROT|nr:unnamed protein product [Paramecium octaurelia]